MTPVPPATHWTAIFNGPGAESYVVYIDVCTPARWIDDHTVEMIDMDLDVVRRANGEVALLDEDEFSDHMVEFAYPAQLVSAIRVTAAELVLAVEGHREPFGDVWFEWWAQAVPMIRLESGIGRASQIPMGLSVLLP